jgi:UDP-N-acetylmuramyl pentapeptide phosphotransferase/UDP-N-acetylglucosamine-1-phosphate transferase
MSVVLSAAIVIFAALFCAALIVLTKPLLARYALAIPNARSSHTTPTPQGGGAVVIAAAIITAGGAFFLMASPGDVTPLLTLLGAVIVMSGIGVTADLHAIGVAPRLLLQTAVVAAVIFALPPDMRFTPFLPWGAERLCLVIGTLWFINLVNFMDGLDWMTVAEVVPLTAAVAIIGLLGVLPPQIIVISLALCGAMIGFAYFNRPVAKLFLGDIGSLPVGLTLGWLLILLAGHGAHTAAVLLPLYYAADATITLLRRLANGEPVWRAHRTHFYQRATNGGFTVLEVVARVFAVNLALCALAISTVIMPGRMSDAVALVVGVSLVAWLLTAFARGKTARRERRA